MLIATWNVNSLRVRLTQMKDWLAANPVDVMVLQETKLPDADFPRDEIESIGMRVAFSGQRTYNGVAILAKQEPADVVAGIPGFEDEQKRVLAATVGGVRVIDVYVPNGQTVGSDKFEYKLRWLEALRGYVATELERHPQLVVLGDYNIAPEDRDVHDPKAWEGLGARERTGAGRAEVAAGARARGLLPPLRAAGEGVFVVGLPDDGFPAQRRSQNRPDPREHETGRKVRGKSHRQDAPQARTAVRPHSGAGDV